MAGPVVSCLFSSYIFVQDYFFPNNLCCWANNNSEKKVKRKKQLFAQHFFV